VDVDLDRPAVAGHQHGIAEGFELRPQPVDVELLVLRLERNIVS